MKKLVLGLVLNMSVLASFAQTSVPISTQTAVVKQLPLDKSPMDMAYFPSDYPLLKTQNKTTQPPMIRVIYSRPQRDNRTIFGELVEYNKVWRLGANEATEIEFFKDAVIAGKKIVKGRYTLYAVPSPDKWTIVINKDTDTWGAFVYDEKKDLLRTDVPVQKLADTLDVFSIELTKTEKGAAMTIAWENVSVTIPIEIKESTPALPIKSTKK